MSPSENQAQTPNGTVCLCLECECVGSKNHRVTFSGGKNTGNYIVEMCQECYDADDKRFIVSEETTTDESSKSITDSKKNEVNRDE